jgi:hypothetical protein
MVKNAGGDSGKVTEKWPSKFGMLSAIKKRVNDKIALRERRLFRPFPQNLNPPVPSSTIPSFPPSQIP